MMPDGFTSVAGGALRILKNYGSVHNQEERVEIALKQVNGAIQSIIKNEQNPDKSRKCHVFKARRKSAWKNNVGKNSEAHMHSTLISQPCLC